MRLTSSVDHSEFETDDGIYSSSIIEVMQVRQVFNLPRQDAILPGPTRLTCIETNHDNFADKGSIE